MRRPSAYCATSSGIAMLILRVSVHPVCPSAVLTRLQSSVGAGGASSVSASSFKLGASVRESSVKSAGGVGGFGMGTGGILDDFVFFLSGAFLGVGCSSG